MWLTGGVILLIRLTTLAGRLALTIYITAMLGLTEMGQFGLVLGAVALVPALVGMGLNFHLCRAVVGDDPAGRIGLVRDRMRWTLAMLAVATAVGLPVLWLIVGPPTLTMGLVVGLLWCEALAVDAYLALTGLRRNALANVSVAVRTAGWIPIAIALGWTDPALRSLDIVLTCWLGGQLANLALLSWWLWRESWIGRWRRDPPTDWVRDNRAGGLKIWPSDIALVLIAFGDRFILSATVPDAMLGIYVFYWTFANTIQTLGQAAIVTPALPRLIEMHQSDRGAWLRLSRTMGLSIAVAGAVLGGGALAAIWIGHRFVPDSNFPWAPGVGALVFAAAVARFLGDFLSTVMNSAGAVRDYAVLNVAFAVCLLLGVAIGAQLGGIVGAALASLLCAASFGALKLRAILKQSVPTRPLSA